MDSIQLGMGMVLQLTLGIGLGLGLRVDLAILSHKIGYFAFFEFGFRFLTAAHKVAHKCQRLSQTDDVSSL